MARRFSDLEKSAIAILANGGNPATSSDERVARYWQWKTNPTSAAHKLLPASKRPNGRKKFPRYIKPFSIDLALDQLAKVQISARTAAAAGTGMEAACGYELLTGIRRSIGIKRFKPAQVYWRTGAATESVSRGNSRITNQPYKSYFSATDEGYVASFGEVGSDTVSERQQAIVTALGAAINLIAFSPEKYSG